LLDNELTRGSGLSSCTRLPLPCRLRRPTSLLTSRGSCPRSQGLAGPPWSSMPRFVPRKLISIKFYALLHSQPPSTFTLAHSCSPILQALADAMMDPEGAMTTPHNAYLKRVRQWCSAEAVKKWQCVRTHHARVYN